MRFIKFDYNYLFTLIILVIGCSSKMKERKIKSIEYYRFDSKVESDKADNIFKTKLGLYKVENYNTNGNLIRENGFDNDKKQDNVIENKFDSNNNLIEKQTFKNYYNQPLTKTYLTKYIYKNNLLVETLSYYGTFDSTGFWARNKTSYNDKNQKVRDEYISYNDDAEKETITYDWKEQHSYIADKINKEGILAERHFVRLDKNGKELEHRMNFGVTSNSDFTFPTYFVNSFDEYGNVLVSKNKYKGKPEQLMEYKYLYEGEYWNYKLLNIAENFSTEFRRITYF